MFTVHTITDTVRIAPADLGLTTADAVLRVLDAIYIDFVIQDLGLVIAIYDILEISGGFLFPSEGCPTFEVSFRVVLFRPLIGEILVGTLVKSNSEALKVSVDFFEDISVPTTRLQDPSTFDVTEKLWCWAIDESGPMYYEMGSRVRLVVEEIKFNPLPTGAPPEVPDGAEPEIESYTPMEIVGVMDKDGLGCLAWWAGENSMETGAEEPLKDE